MKIAIPTAEGKLTPHFGHCEKFAIVTVDENAEIGSPEFVTPPPHEPGVLPQWLAEKQVTLIIAGGMGQRAKQLFDNNGIQVITGAPAELPQVLVQQHLNGSLTTGINLCDH
ncbi:NifB/NifX family molybdenum-iron cluster-binding protein [uncultured Desulfuromonas sp.]|uniref:NifB/NifX family molybdenum-iron cluster-binding protein n=1 Tax=uncultured Desulfuromonas sp. TaxID=181013 RepID=UPI002AAA7251|nr:NifB/NifX family molybdenum-iron cluster-binding protein [uncultured Desulfuromonas sp.]